MLPYVQDDDLDYQEIGAEELARGSARQLVHNGASNREQPQF